MTALAMGLLLLAAWLAVWSYLLYPPWIRLLSARQPERPAPGGAPAPVEVLIAAADEEAVIGERIRDLLAQEYPGSYAISVGCDGCEDRTAAVAREAASGDPRVQVVEFPARRGKASVVNDLVAASRAEILVFTDADTRFEPGAVGRLARRMADPRVGAACGRLILEAGQGATPETIFWERETRLKQAEGRLGVCLGANGAIYAARHASVEPLPADTAMDDFLIPARIARRGEEVVFVAEAVARESLPADVRRELSRRFRIGVGAGQVLRRERWLWNLRERPLLATVFLSRKAARWLAPVLALLAAAAAAGSPVLRPAGLAALFLAALLALVAGARLRLPGALGRLYYFGVINLALAAGVLAGLLGYRCPAWKAAGR